MKHLEEVDADDGPPFEAQVEGHLHHEAIRLVEGLEQVRHGNPHIVAPVREPVVEVRAEGSPRGRLHLKVEEAAREAQTLLEARGVRHLHEVVGRDTSLDIEGFAADLLCLNAS